MGGIKDILVLHHSHLDLGYTHSPPVMKALQIEFIDQALDLLDETASWPEISRPKWTCEVTQPVLWWLEQAGRDSLSRFEAHLGSGRLAISALSYNGTPLSDAVSLSHQFRNKKYLEERFEIEIKTVNIHDVNGIPWPLVDMMLDEGIELLTMAVNTHLGRQLDERPGVFRWAGPSGRSILVLNGAHYTMFDQNLYSWEGSVHRMQQGWKEYSDYLEGKKYPYDFCYLTTTHAPQMWDNSPPNPFTAGLIREWNQGELNPPIRYVTPLDLLGRIREQSPDTIPLKSGDWTDYWIFGSGATAHETKVNREARRMIFAADLAGALGGDSASPGREERSDFVYEGICEYEEHTQGSFDTRIANEQYIAQEHLITHNAYSARENAFFRLAEELDSMAENPGSTERFKSLLIFNPSGVSQEYYTAVPESWRRKGRFIRANRFQNENLLSGRTGELCGPVTVEPYSFVNIGLEQLSPVPRCEKLEYFLEEVADSFSSLNIDFTNVLSEKKSCSTGLIRSNWYEMRFDSATGHILSLKDRVRNREVLSDEKSGFFNYVLEHPGGRICEGRDSFFTRNLDREKRDLSNWQDWQRVYGKASGAVSVNVEEYPHEIVLSTVFTAPGVQNLTRRISIRGYSALIGIDISFLKDANENPEGTYFTIPLSLGKGWQAHFDTAAVSTELDTEQLEGSCLGWQCVDNYLSMHESGFGAALFSPDTPLVMAGGFHFGPPKNSIPRGANPLMISWPMNNYWDTNFSRIQPGYKQFHYEFTTHGDYNPVELARIADGIRNPVRSTPSASEPFSSRQILHCDNSAVRILGVRYPDNDGKIHICLINNSLTDTEVNIGILYDIEEAWFSTPGGHLRNRIEVSDGHVLLNLLSRKITFIMVENTGK